MQNRFLSIALVALFPSACFASTIVPVVTSTPGTPYTTAAMSGYATTNADMLGSIVTVTFANGDTSSAIWTTAGASNALWSLKETGDTYSDPFTLKNTAASAIVGFSFNGVPGNTTFDIIRTPIDTPGSNLGLPFSTVSTTGSASLTADANYTDELIVGGRFYGDEYTMLDVTLGGGGLATGKTLSYYTDTDNASASSPIVVASATPEPFSLVLLATGAMGVAGAARRRARKA